MRCRLAAAVAALLGLTPTAASAIEVPLAWCTAGGSNCSDAPPAYGGPTPADWKEAAQLFCTRYAAAHLGRNQCLCDGTACSTVTGCDFQFPGATPTASYLGANSSGIGTVTLSATDSNGVAWANTYNGPATCGCPSGAVFNAAAACVCQANWVWDGVQCVWPGSCTAPRKVDGEACVCIDPNATWSGASCECKADYILSGGVCVPKCTDAKCGATCSARSITVSPPAVTFDDDTGQVKCPGIFGGSAGVTMAGSASYASTSATCSTGCRATESVRGTASGAVTVCSGRGFASRGDVASDVTLTFNKSCDKASCATVCDSGVCQDRRASVALSGGTTWALGATFGRGPRGMWPVSVSCKASVVLLAGGKYESHEVSQTGGFQGPCLACSESTFGPTVSGKGAGSCSVAWAGRQARTKISSGFSAEYAQEMLYTKKSGCGAPSEHCLTSTISGKLEGSVTACLGAYGRNVKLGAKYAVGGTCSGSSCGGTTSGCDWTPTVSTAVVGRCD